MNSNNFNYTHLINGFGYNEYLNLQYSDVNEINAIQNRLFLDHFNYAINNSPFYKNFYSTIGLDFNDIKTIEDIIKLPFTNKKDINNTFISVDQKEIVDLSFTSGTSGIPTIVPLTSKDLGRLAFNEEVAFQIAGVTHDDTMLICAAIDKCFMAGIAYFLGGVKLKARMVRAGSNDSAQTWEMINFTNASVIVGVPSLIYRIGQYALENGKDPANCKVRKLIAIGEPIRDKDLKLIPVAAELEKMWNAKIYSTYASSEIATTFCECEKQQGGHVRPELNVVEIIDQDGKNVGDGSFGEVVTTPLGITGMPLIRFKTGDISFLINKTCECGRSTKRIGPIIGRKNQMLKYKGTSIFPDAILSVLEGEAKFHSGYIEALRNSDGTDRVILYASLTKKVLNIDIETSWIKEKLSSKLRVSPEIKLITQQETDNKIYQFDKKRKRQTFFDLR
ncbi:MAG: phenylacetate--CoA ligase [Desulfobacteraceae bacterium]|nr:phenylacetate--CoA ligase [Desulfobacteraceae bacterium]